MAKMDPKYQEDFFSVGIWCGIGEQGETLAPLPEIGFPTSQSSTLASASDKSPKPPALRPRAFSRTPLSSIPTVPKSSNAKGSPVTVDENDGYDSNAYPAQGARSVAEEHFAQAPAPRIKSVNFDRDRSLVDDDDDKDVPYGDLPEDGTESTCPESCPPSPYPAPAAVMLDYAPDDALALEVGHTAFEYLEECFHYTEVSVLDREKFNAIPEIVKSDFIITGHLGKGNFSDVFEVIRKSASRASPPAAHNMSPPQSGRRRSRRSSDVCPLSVSVTTATLARPSCGERRAVFALKCLRPGIRSDPEQFTIGAEDLVHETAILATLDHRHIIKLHGRASGNLADAFVMNDGYFILLDRLSETLYDRMGKWKVDRHIKLGEPTLQQIEVGHSVADALSYLHSKNIVFRDLKPDNVGFDASGVLKLFDFGFAVGLPEKNKDNPAGFLFDRCGTPRYMAPEVGLSLGYGLSADVYSYGVLLWEVCMLNKPFAAVKSSVEFERTVFIGGKRPKVEDRWPAVLRRLMVSCWSASPNKRPADWMTVKSSLSSLMANKDGTMKNSVNPSIRSKLRSSMARRSMIEGYY